ncbi:hypothetical protein EKD16_04180 [Streptomonospora litoralis]|uniref:Uncharacterized protein n=1 Tax=Streptomonospora litoralis TaxID=2498135 RepID=A0A4P6PWN3_9ACTN|nr:hypothetical protein EKD16_04180 [Streptomonospora litoralis]
MITIFQLGSLAVSGGSVAMSWGTLRGCATRAEFREAGVLGDLCTAAQTRPGTGRERYHARLARMANVSRLESKPAAGTQRLMGVVGECPRGIPA